MSWFSSERRPREEKSEESTDADAGATAMAEEVTYDGPVPSDDLWDLVLDMDWQGAIEDARANPINAKWQDGHWDETPLYLACQFHPPAHAVQAIIAAFPGAVSIPSRANRDLPIHLACRYQLPRDVLEVLVLDFPFTAVEQTKWGKTALNILWEFRPPILDEGFWAKVLLLLRAVARYREDPRYSCHRAPGASNQAPRFRSKAAEQCHEVSDRSGGSSAIPDGENDRGDEELSLVHAAASLGARCCPAEILEYVTSEHPSDVSKRDQWHELPLHIAIGPTAWSRATKRKYKPRELSVIRHLLSIYPNAAKERMRFGDDKWRYPLHTALANGHYWSRGVKDIFEAAPSVLMVADPTTKLYPFQLAAVPVGGTISADLDTVFELLRSQPTVLTCFDLKERRESKKRDPVVRDQDAEPTAPREPPSPPRRPTKEFFVVGAAVSAMLLHAWTASPGAGTI